MNKSTLILVLVVVLGGIGYMNRSSLARLMTSSNAPQQSQRMPVQPVAGDADETVSGDDASGVDAGVSSSYVDYSQASLDSSSGGRRVLFFYANWCPTCRSAHDDFSTALTLPKNVQLIRVNYNDSDTDDAEKALAKKYGVSYQHTFVEIDSSGQMVQKWNGGESAELLGKL